MDLSSQPQKLILVKQTSQPNMVTYVSHPTFRRLRQEDGHEFKVSLTYRVFQSNLFT